jgi:hypothetical protein
MMRRLAQEITGNAEPFSCPVDQGLIMPCPLGLVSTVFIVPAWVSAPTGPKLLNTGVEYGSRDEGFSGFGASFLKSRSMTCA